MDGLLPLPAASTSSLLSYRWMSGREAESCRGHGPNRVTSTVNPKGEGRSGLRPQSFPAPVKNLNSSGSNVGRSGNLHTSHSPRQHLCMRASVCARPIPPHVRSILLGKASDEERAEGWGGEGWQLARSHASELGLGMSGTMKG